MTVWNDRHILTTYRLAKSGSTQLQIAKAIGITEQTFIIWKKKYPTLREALRGGCAERKGKHADKITFRDVVTKRMPERLKEVWNDLRRFEREKTGIGKIEAMLEEKGKKFRQYLFIHALMMGTFNGSKARRKVNVSLKTYNDWLENDPDFADLAAEVEACKKDFFEDYLIKLVKSLDSSAIRMVNETYNADRGYGQKIKQEVETTTVHEHVVKISVLGLSIDEKRMLLEKVRQRKQIESREVKNEAS